MGAGEQRRQARVRTAFLGMRSRYRRTESKLARNPPARSATASSRRFAPTSRRRVPPHRGRVWVLRKTEASVRDRHLEGLIAKTTAKW